MGLVKPILMAYRAIVIKRHGLITRNLLHIIQIPFGKGRPILNEPFYHHRFLGLKIVLDELCFRNGLYPGNFL